jgi:hypothetical protein
MNAWVADGGYLEREAERLYRSAGLDPMRAAAPAALVRGSLGANSIRFLREELIPGGGTIARVGPEWRIYLSRKLSPDRMRFIALHELAHWALGPGASEGECDALAACLLAPRPAFERAVLEHRAGYTKLARRFGCTETFAALRYGEVTGEPLVVVAPASVRVRGGAYSWPSEAELRGLAKARRLPGLSKATLRDDPLRVALRVG